MPWYVYIAELADGRLYTGHTNNVVRRTDEHGVGKGRRTTRVFGFRSILHVEEHADEAGAIRRERQLKRWSGQKKRALAVGDIPLLKKLVQRRTPKSSQ